MTTRVEIGSCTLYRADCRDLLGSVAADVIITDPPYGEATHRGARTLKDLADRPICFDSITPEEFMACTRRFVSVARRWVVMTCAWQHAARLEASDLPLVRLGVWVKPNGAPQFTGDRPGTGWEAVAILHREGRKRWNGGGHHAVWQCNIEQGEHPTQKPLRLISDWVKQFSDPGETVLDPFAGSGTTGVACIRLGRRFIGIERDPRWFDLMCRRIEEARNRPDLFAPKPEPRPVQITLF
ncbi:DNA-methyltransferase [Tautonia rosea]|uniref:DNA-methyltransferase n=1 Tax=Tautonia rosea TaxID=2728037 RepID=UPI001476114C|nr:site-specific DNA-methyltransferase [Tautonia rosea]